jgi:hypothetical protein
MKRRRIDSHPEPQKVADFRDFRSAAVPMLHLRAPSFAGVTQIRAKPMKLIAKIKLEHD